MGCQSSMQEAGRVLQPGLTTSLTRKVGGRLEPFRDVPCADWCAVVWSSIMARIVLKRVSMAVRLRMGGESCGVESIIPSKLGTKSKSKSAAQQQL